MIFDEEAYFEREQCGIMKNKCYQVKFKELFSKIVTLL